MSATGTVIAIKFQIKYADNNGTYTFSKIKNSASTTDSKILATAQAFASIQEYEAEKIFKLVDTVITNS